MTRHLMLACALAAVSASADAAPRVLLESADAEVRMERDLRCGRDAEVLVITRDPRLFSGDSPRMQSLLDATRAVLGFECRNLAGIVVSGRLAGMDNNSYQAVAGPESEWRLDASRTVQVSALDSREDQSRWRPPEPTRAAADRYTVRDLHRGMNVEAALAAAREGFSAEPQYDRDRRLLSVVDGGCPVAGESLQRDFWPRPGDTCLEAGFSGRGGDKLQWLTFGQVVDMDQSASIRSALERRYGPPTATSRPADGTTRLSWGTRLPDTDGRHELEAEIGVREEITVLVIELAAGSDQPRFQADF